MKCCGPRSNPEFASTSDTNGRVTTKGVRRLIDSLKEMVTHQATLIKSTKAEILEVKHDQNALQSQNEKLHEEVRTLREQIKAPFVDIPDKIMGSPGQHLTHQTNEKCPERDHTCVRISTQRSFADPRDNDNSDGNTFGRYLPTEAANTHIRTALLRTPPRKTLRSRGLAPPRLDTWSGSKTKR